MILQSPAKKSILAVLLPLMIVMGGCDRFRTRTADQKEISSPIDSIRDTFPVDPMFIEFFYFLGGEELLGPAITPLLESGNLRTQYFESSLLVYDPQSPQGETFRLESLGLMFGVAEPAIPKPNRLDAVYINGHVIYEKFLPLYRKLGGARFVGRPLTEVRYNLENRRIEQYFENLGFYILDHDQSESVHLLAYGVLACDLQCRYNPLENNLPNLKPSITSPFAAEVSRLGFSFTGRNLTEPHLAADGKMEVIFENLVLVYEPEIISDVLVNPSETLWLPIILMESKEILFESKVNLIFQFWLPQVLAIYPLDSLDQKRYFSFNLMVPLVFASESQLLPKIYVRPITEVVGVNPQPLVNRLDDPLMVFYQIDGEKGHHVPLLINEYLLQHGGVQVSGLPITEIFHLNDGIFRQCFTNLCLNYSINAPENERIKLVPLGVVYWERYYNAPEVQFSEQTLVNVDLRTWEEDWFVTSGQTQVIWAAITENTTPLKNREPVLTIDLPGGEQFTYSFPPTGEDGRTSLKVPPIKAPNGSLIPYRVCLDGIGEDSLCVEDNYIIWNYR